MPRGSVVKRDVEMRVVELSQERRAETEINWTLRLM